MKKSFRAGYSTIVLLFVFFLSSCEKGFLDEKPDHSLVVPSTLSDMQALLDNVAIMNYGAGLPILASDDYTVSRSTLNSFSTAAERNAYVWAADIYEGGVSEDWNALYQQIFYANVVMDGLRKIEVSSAQQSEWNRMMGSALFFRGFALYQLVEEFAAPYDASAAATLPGVPVKLSSDVNERPGRGTVALVYQSIQRDLTEALNLLPVRQSVATRPGRHAVWALLARIGLTMQNYEEAKKFADSCISFSPALIDFNTLSTSSTRPIALDNAETIFNYYMIDYSFAASASISISPEIQASYNDNDLRKLIYFRSRGNNVFNFKGNYTGNRLLFTGLATDEIYLIRAECRTRVNDIAGAMDDLNALMKMRWNNKVPFPSFSAGNSEEALQKILTERRKELITRGTRWSDLRRLNQDSRFAVILSRSLDNVTSDLPPGDNRYTFPIPQNEINGSGIEQNPR